MLWWRLWRIKSKKSWIRARAAEKLGHSKDPRAFQALVIALTDGNESVRRTAAEALGEIGDLQAAEPLATVLKDNDTNVWWWPAAQALGKIGDPRAIEPLVVELAHVPSYERSSVVGVLNRIDPNWMKSDGAKAAVTSLVARLTHTDHSVRNSAEEALNQIPDWIRSDGARAAIPLLIAGLPYLSGYSDDYAREKAERTLSQINPNWMKSDEAKAAIPSLLDALTAVFARMRSRS